MIKDMGNMKNGKYRETSKMSDLICENYPMVLVMSRFGIDLGFGEKNIGEVCRQNKIDTYTFLTVVNFLTETETIPAAEVHKDISISSLITYLHNAHAYFLDFRLPHDRGDRELPERCGLRDPPLFRRICRRGTQTYVVRRENRLPVCPQFAGRKERPEI